MHSTEPRGGLLRQPFPDPWKQHPPQYDMSRVPEGYEVRTAPGVQFSYMGIDGNMKTVNQQQQQGSPGIAQICCLNCCPCIVPPLCSKEKKEEYLSAAKSFTAVISTLQLLLLIVALIMGGFAPPKDNLTFGPPTETLQLLGAKDTSDIQSGQVWRFVTPILLHSGFIHLFFNIFAQLRFGLALERRWGLLRFIPLYFLSGIGGVIFSCLIQPSAIGVGASGAIMGLMGAFLANILLTWKDTEPMVRRLNLFQVIIVVGLIMLLSLLPYVDFGAHFGGLITGFFIGCCYFSKESHIGFIQKYGHYLAATLLTLLLVVDIILIYLVI